MKLAGQMVYVKSTCPNALASNVFPGGHTAVPSTIYAPFSSGMARWTVCVACGARLWGLHVITEETDLW